MLKELILAIILGGILGFGVTGTMVAINKKNPPPSSPSPAPPTPAVTSLTPAPLLSPTPTVGQDISQTSPITINTPENYAVINSSKITISGSTTAQSLIVITLGDQSYQTKAQDSGAFSQDVDLETGANFINVTAIDQNDNQFQAQLVITYSTAKF